MTTASDIEQKFWLTLLERHCRALVDASDPIHGTSDFLLPLSKYKLLRFVETNESLRARPHDPWPDFLVAFASNGCGDFFAYDVRERPHAIIYVDPDLTVSWV